MESRWSGVTKSKKETNNDESIDYSTEGKTSDDLCVENVMAATVTGDGITNGEESVNKSHASGTSGIIDEKAESVNEDTLLKPSAVNEVKAASAVSPVQSVSAPATRSTAVYTPSAVRSEGASTVSSTPATGDYGITAAVTVAAIAAGAGIVAAAVMLKRRRTD